MIRQTITNRYVATAWSNWLAWCHQSLAASRQKPKQPTRPNQNLLQSDFFSFTGTLASQTSTLLVWRGKSISHSMWQRNAAPALSLLKSLFPQFPGSVHVVATSRSLNMLKRRFSCCENLCIMYISNFVTGLVGLINRLVHCVKEQRRSSLYFMLFSSFYCTFLLPEFLVQFPCTRAVFWLHVHIFFSLKLWSFICYK